MDCIREQKKVFDTAEVQDYMVAFGVSAVLSFIGSIVVSVFGFFLLLVIFLGPAAGVLIAETVRKLVSRRRSKILFQTVVWGIIIGGLPLILPGLLGLISGTGIGSLFRLILAAVFTFLAASSAYARLTGIRIR